MKTDSKSTELRNLKPKPTRKPTTITQTADLIKAIGPDRKRLAEAGFSISLVYAAADEGLITSPMLRTVLQCCDPAFPW